MAPDYDLDGNLVDDGTFEYTWDMENRLLAIEPKTPVEDVSKRLEFKYDYMGRRIRKIVQTWADPDTNGYDWEEDTDGDHLFIYDQWNVLLVLDAYLFGYVTGISADRGFQWGGGVNITTTVGYWVLK